MAFKAHQSREEQTPGRIWRFADCEFDELARVLRVRGQTVELELKPLELLLHLLLHAGEVVTKEELLEAVWPDVLVVDSSLATAVSKLRKAVGDEDRPIVSTVPRVGYRLAVPVACQTVAAPPGPELGLQAGDSVPRREQWRLLRPLERSGSSEVWVAENRKTREQRVFKFAADAARLKSLKREITVSRYLYESLGERPDFVRMLEWNLEVAPFFLESEYVGPSLAEWAEQQGGLSQVPIATRLRLFVEIAQAVAAAHDVGVLHKDLKPANILVVCKPEGQWQVKVADFGSASLFDPSRLQALGITNLGFTQNEPEGSLTGTLMYLAPEVLAGQSPSASADVYALGLLLYQLLIGDFRKPLAPGWEEQIEDPLLREDIAEAACGDSARRLSSAAVLAERLLTLDQRRIRVKEIEAARARAQAAEHELAVARARRPWIIVAIVVLAAAFGISFALYRSASRERDLARRQKSIADAINHFLADDLLGRGNPFLGSKSSETLIEAIRQSSPAIDLKFQSEPLVAAGLHHTIARAFDNRTDYPDARREYERTVALYRQTDGELSQDAIIVQLQRVTLEARSYEKGSLDLAKSLLAEQENLLGRLARPRPELQVWRASARGMVALIDNRAKTAADEFELALKLASALPTFDESARLTLQQRLAFAYIRLGDGSRAETILRDLIAKFSDLTGSGSPNVLRVRLNLAQAFMIQNKHREAVEETTAIYPEFVSRLGPDHELTMQVLTTRAQSEGALGAWDDAIRDDLAIHDVAVRKQGPMSFFAVATLSDAALAMCRSGRTAEGTGNARRAYLASSKAFGPRAGLTGGTAATLATCLVGLGKLDEASKLLDDIDVPAVAQLAGDPDWGAGIKLLLAQIAYRRGQFDLARTFVREIAPVFSRPSAEAYQRQALQTLVGELAKQNVR